MKKKVTFNISESTLLKLEDAWIHIRRQLKKRVTKTAVVEMALEICIEDLNKRGEQSALYTELRRGTQ